MKYGIFLGRGVEGCGNTKYAIELQNGIKETDECITIAARDKNWGRSKAHNHNIIQYHLYNDKERIISTFKQCDTIIILSVPPINAEFETTESFMEILERLQDKHVVYINVDHRAPSIKRNFYYDIMYNDFFKLCNRVITHNKGNDLHVVALEMGLDPSTIITPEFPTLNLLDFADGEKYIRPYDDKEPKSIHFLGRRADWKGIYEVKRLQYEYLGKHGFTTVMEGIERDIGSLKFLYKEVKPDKIAHDDVIICNEGNKSKLYFKGKLPTVPGNPAYIIGPYNHDEAMERLGASMFGIELLMLPDKYLPHNMEYAMSEYVITGTVPIYRKRWGELFCVNNKPVISQDCGAIFVDENDMAASIDEILEVACNKELYMQRQNRVYDFFRSICDKKVILPQVLELINGNNN